MNISLVADYLWGKKAKLSYLMLAAALILFSFLGAREIWTQEHRWADIVAGMFYRHDFLHPYLGTTTYYDKPLLSYWLIALVSELTGALTTLQLRIPSALAGFLAVWSIFRLGSIIKDKQLGFITGWLLLTTFYFIFWARTSSADMLNLAGSLFAITWYFCKRTQANFIDYTIFFVIVALTSLCKGLVGAIVPLIAVLIDIILQKSWKQHLRWSLVLSIIPALVIYLLPFWASSHFGGSAYKQDGLALVYRENILRYFHPFDHEGPIYTYFIYLPIYLLPWAIFFVPALVALPYRYKTLSINQKWIVWTLLSVFVFFTLSGSRRSYYVLPIVPFAILFTADWIAAASSQTSRKLWSAGAVAIAFIGVFFSLDILPAWYYSHFGINRFANLLEDDATKVKPWSEWNFVMLDAESKLNFYLRLAPDTKNYKKLSDRNESQIDHTLLKSWPVLSAKPTNTIFITRKMYASALQKYFTGYHLVALNIPASLPFIKNYDANAPVAFVPN